MKRSWLKYRYTTVPTLAWRIVKITRAVSYHSPSPDRDLKQPPPPLNAKQVWHPLVHDACHLNLSCKRNVNLHLQKRNTVSALLDQKNAIHLFAFASLRFTTVLLCRLPQVPLFVLRIIVMKMGAKILLWTTIVLKQDVINIDTWCVRSITRSNILYSVGCASCYDSW
jgi:hypothetical protein